MHILIRDVSAINSNVEETSIRKAIEVGALSWEMIENQGKEVLLKKLKAIDLLDESQCNELFDKINGMKPSGLQRKRRDYVLMLIRVFYSKWIMNCMYAVCEGFQ